MSAREVSCPSCTNPLPPGFYNIDKFFTCPHCTNQVRVDVFPSLFRQDGPGGLGEKIVMDSEAGCFYHPRKKATVHCSNCGRFLCALCDMDINGSHICPQCLETGTRTHAVKNLENRTVLYDRIALSLAIIPLLFFWITIFTAPAALYVAIRYWKAQRSVLPRTKIRFVVAMLIAGAQVTGWAFGFAYLMSKIF